MNVPVLWLLFVVIRLFLKNLVIGWRLVSFQRSIIDSPTHQVFFFFFFSISFPFSFHTPLSPLSPLSHSPLLPPPPPLVLVVATGIAARTPPPGAPPLPEGAKIMTPEETKTYSIQLQKLCPNIRSHVECSPITFKGLLVVVVVVVELKELCCCCVCVSPHETKNLFIQSQNLTPPLSSNNNHKHNNNNNNNNKTTINNRIQNLSQRRLSHLFNWKSKRRRKPK